MSILDCFSLQGKTVLITGGAGMYGRQIVAAVAEAGATTFIASRNLDALETLAQEHREAGHNVTALAYDQGDEASILKLRDEVLAHSGCIDALVNNSVARPMRGAYQDVAEHFGKSMHVNATGLFMITRAIGDAMADGGSIINIGSIQGMVGPDPTIYRGTSMSGWYPDYFFHKAGMINFTRFLASYYGQRGIRCNCVSPGGLLQPANHPEAFIRNYSDRTFLGRLANDTDLMGIVVFLASDASAYITGTNIPVDGGYTAK